MHTAIRMGPAALCAIELPTFSLLGWAMETRAKDLLTGRVTPDTRTDEQMKLLEFLKIAGNNGWHGSYAEMAVPPMLAKLRDAGLALDVVLGVMLARGASVSGIQVCSVWRKRHRRMDVRMAVLRQAVGGAKFYEGNMVARVMQEARCTRDQVWEALWGLVGEGLIYLDPDRQGSGNTDNWRWRASSIGIQAATGGRWEPRDPQGYLRRLRRFQPPVDEGALVYVEEALRAFNARCYLATSVMLGVAAESVFNGLAETFVIAEPTRTIRLQKALAARSHQNTRFQELRKALEPIRAQLPDGLADPVTLDAVADLLRTARNEAGHPTGKPIDEGTAHTHLYMGAELLQKMTALQTHFKNQPTAAST